MQGRSIRGRVLFQVRLHDLRAYLKDVFVSGIDGDSKVRRRESREQPAYMRSRVNLFVRSF